MQPVERLSSAVSWAAQAELAAFALALGPVSHDVRRALVDVDDADVRYLGGDIDRAAFGRIRLLVERTVASRLDRSPQVSPSDPIANALAMRVFFGGTRSARELAAHALALSPYASDVGAALAATLHDSTEEIELRRAAGFTLFQFPTTNAIRKSLRRGCTDPDPSVRARSVASLTPHMEPRDRDLVRSLIDNADQVVRRCTVDAANAANFKHELEELAAQPDAAIASAAGWYLGEVR